MERQMLRLTMVLGILVTILGGTGVFAVFSDTARGEVRRDATPSRARNER